MQAWKAGVLMVAVCVAPWSSAAAQDGASPAVLREAIEPVSGARIRLFDAPKGEVAFDVSAGGVTVAKRVGAAAATTTVTAGHDAIAIRLTASRLVIEDRAGRVTFEGGDRVAAEAIRARLAASPLVRRALDLLGEVRFREISPMAQLLVATRQFLAETSGIRETTPVSRNPLAAASAVVVSRVVDGPGDCWNEYSKEAIAAYIEYEQCMAETKWYQLAPRAACEFVYEMRAIGAFSWWVACTGLDNFKA
ncbi:MAG: hypothetical protein R2752_14610 [Vicinamibacterales bacterium]